MKIDRTSAESGVNDNTLSFDGFGTFLRDYKTKQNSVGGLSRVTVQLDKAADGSATYPSFSTSEKYNVALHLSFDEAYDASGKVYEVPPDITFGDSSSYFAGVVNQVPEFPTMALPVAAILGLLFITQRRKEN